MVNNLGKRLLTLLLALCLTISVMAPATAYAAGDEPEAGAGTIETGIEGEDPAGEDPAGEDPAGEDPDEEDPDEEDPDEEDPDEEDPDEEDPDEEDPAEEEDPEDGIDGQSEEELEVTNYADFLAALKVLEGYAAEYASANTANTAAELVLNYIRTGVERYNDSEWTMLAGAEITGFVTYVAEQDALNDTTAGCLRNIVINNFKLPNGNQVDFGHMFGTMNISFVNKTSRESADLAGWAGDICDLLFYSKYDITVPAGTLEEQTAYVLNNCFGVNADNAFGMDDFYGDMDAFYLIEKMKAGHTLSAVMEAYFTADLSDADRSEFFMKNRFEKLYTKESVREAIHNAYANNVGLKVLEAKRGLSGEAQLRQACCYAFADFIYEQAGHTLEEPGEEPDPEEPTEPENPEEPEETDNPYYSVFSSETTNLAPGITQTVKLAHTADNKQLAYYLATVDVTREDVTIMAGYNNADPSQGWAMQRVLDQANAMEARHSNPEDPDNYIENFRAIVATNGAGFNMSTGEPGGLLVMGGKEWHAANNNGFFGIMKDGTARIGTTAEYEQCKGDVMEAIAGFGATLIKDGVIVTKDNGGRASRTAIGIKADGSVVMMVLDGRQEPFSAGGSMVEIAQIMLDAGCVHAINLDGGGSTTFVSKAEGSDSLALVNRPSDGYQRSVSTSLIAVSTAETSNEFSYANISSEYDYLTVGTKLNLTAVGVSLSGNAAAIPENAVWQVSDETIGVVSDGVFTAKALGDAEVHLMVDGQSVGSKTLHVVVPDKLFIEQATMNVVYGVTYELPLQASYNNNLVKFNANDVIVVLQYSNAGPTNGLSFSIREAAGYRTLLAGAALLSDMNIYAMMTLNCYRADEAVFDFDKATAGNETFAWNRMVSNAISNDGKVYQIVDTDGEMEISYVFALDMQSIEIPEKLKELTSMLPGSDLGNKTAWAYMLDLAERVSTLTTVTIEAQFDPDLELDCSGMTISNDFFEMDSVSVDEATNKVTIKARWIDRTAAVNAASANSVCILSGIKMKPKADANWDAKNRIAVQNIGEVSYDVYLRASALYSFANQVENQKVYNLYPFVNPNDPSEKGASFSADYATFEDEFVLDSTNRQGWYGYNDQMFYFVDNKEVTGIQLLPGYDDPANKYFYEFDENGVCQRMVSGLIELEGDLYYAIAGAPKTGWATVSKGADVHYYYFDPATGKAVDGVQKIGGYTYTFTDKILTRGEVVKNSTGTRYMWAGAWATQEWLNIDGNISYARSNGYFQTGIGYRYSPDGEWLCYIFDYDGVWQKDANGLYEWEGETYYAQGGYMVEYPGLVKIGEDYYYFSSKNTMIRNITYWISKGNGYFPEGRYTFGPDGKMVLDDLKPSEPETPSDPDAPKKHGIVPENDSLFYYVDGKLTYAGLIEIDGAYYYVRTSGELVHGRSYWITKTNGLLPEKSYTFDEDGKIINLPTEEPDQPDGPDTPDTPDVPGQPTVPDTPKKNGIVAENGSLYYYVDGVKTYAGLIFEDGYYYYVNTYGEVKHGCSYWATKNNGLLPSNMYTFDEQGRMIDPPVVTPSEPGSPLKDGIVSENDNLYYYEDGVLTYAGLIKIDNDYYYVNTKGEVKHDCRYWISKTNGLLPERAYTFDSEGRITDVPNLFPDDDPEVEVKNGIVKENGSLYYYVDGVLTYAGLIKIGDYYYYVRTTGELARDCDYWPTKHNDLIKVTQRYHFDSEGRMTNPPV